MPSYLERNLHALRRYLCLKIYGNEFSSVKKALQPAAGVRGYVHRLGTLSRNAKLFLVATVFQGLGSGIWAVLFYLYLNLHEVGFQLNFIGNMFTAGAIATGVVALPAGLLCERIGAKKAILIGLTANLINLAQIVVLQPANLLAASITSGLIGTLASVAATPLLVENSSPEERAYLFSFQSALSITMAVVGSLIGGFMPDLFNLSLGLSTGVNGSAAGYRISLAISITLSLTAVFPILLVKQTNRHERQRMADFLRLRNIKSSKTIIKFMIPTALTGLGAGFVIPLVNPFFKQKYNAGPEQVGVISSLGNITLGIATLLTPALSKRMTRVKFVVLCQYLSMPFIMLTSLSPNLTWAGGSYIVRTSLMNMAGPIGTTFEMESVTAEERATTNGLMVMSDQIPRAVTATISGAMMTGSDFFTPFLTMTVIYLVSSSLYFGFFRNAEARKPTTSTRS
ncbi:MAG TPA: MFS transporter [candidate division Zixibacteria bacterium]|nr:MFS transporter [candidate division Zixibacteria bacterium]